ncbi:MAG TPA: pyruvate formate lyase family protein, partial [Bacteroidales bacterium]|nr:pyruvate formate lyase family protein [Bacteroidales bacterium]
MMTDRISGLRKSSLDAVNRISAERALLVTQFYESGIDREVSVPVMRAMTLDHILTHKELCYTPGELILGERGPAPKACPTYPEICVHSLDDLEILDKREKVSFKVDAATKKIYSEKIIPFWNGRSNRDRLMQSLPADWLEAYRAGIFTEFQEQRGPGHTVAGNKIYRKGMLEMMDEIRETGKRMQDTGCRMEELKAMEIAAGAVIKYAGRYAELLETLSNQVVTSRDSLRVTRHELEELARICRRVPAHAPQTFHEALQYYWFVHICVLTELNPWDSF